MDRLIQTKAFLDEISSSIKRILFKAFPKAAGQDHEDIEQEVKLKLWKMISRGKKIRSLKSYLWKVVYTTAIDVLEKKMDHQPLDDRIEEASWRSLIDLSGIPPEILLERLQTSAHLMDAINRLPQRRRLVLKLHLAGMDLEEISTTLDWSSNQVRHLYYRGLIDLKKSFTSADQSSSLTSEDR